MSADANVFERRDEPGCKPRRCWILAIGVPVVGTKTSPHGPGSARPGRVPLPGARRPPRQVGQGRPGVPAAAPRARHRSGPMLGLPLEDARSQSRLDGAPGTLLGLPEVAPATTPELRNDRCRWLGSKDGRFADVGAPPPVPRPAGLWTTAKMSLWATYTL